MNNKRSILFMDASGEVGVSSFHLNCYPTDLCLSARMKRSPFPWHRGIRTARPPAGRSAPGGGRCRAGPPRCPAGTGPRRWRWPGPTARWTPPRTPPAGPRWRPRAERGGCSEDWLCPFTNFLAESKETFWFLWLSRGQGWGFSLRRLPPL